jgi:CRISPR-associated endonuclease Cas3-HD
MKTDFELQNPLFILAFWGKARADNQAGSSTHSIVYHSLDVAAVGAELIAREQDVLGRIATATGLTDSQLTSVVPFLVSLHDIGKYARVFQAKSPDHWPAIALGPYREIAPGNSHVVTGFQMLLAFSNAGPTLEIFNAVMPGWSASERKILFRALAGHHGRPPDEGERSSLGPHDVCTACVAAAQTHIQAMFALLKPAALPRRPKDQLIKLGVEKRRRPFVLPGRRSFRVAVSRDAPHQLECRSQPKSRGRSCQPPALAQLWPVCNLSRRALRTLRIVCW